MAPKRVVIQSSGAGRRQQEGILSSSYREITSPENATIVRSVLVFSAAVAFLHSSLSEFLLPPL